MSYNRIEFGTFSFEDNAIFSGSIRVAQNPLGTTLEINTAKAEVLCGDPKILQFKLNTPIKLHHLNEQLGVFYAQEVYLVGTGRYRISGVSAIGLLDNMTHYGGIYTGETVGDVLKGLFQSIPYAVKTSIAKIRLYGYLPVATARSNLSQILVACGAIVRTDLDGVIRIEDLYGSPSSVLPPDKVFIKSSVKYNAPVTDVTVVEHQYIKDPATEERVLFEGTVTEGAITTFREPVYDLVAEGVSIIESNANYAKLSGGSAVIKGKEYTHTERVVTHHVQDAEVESIKKVEKATLVSLVNSESVAKRIAEYYRSNEILQMDFIREKQNTGEIIETVNPYEYTAVRGFAESMEIDLGRHLYGEADLVSGYTPERVEDIGILEERVLLTGSGEWIPPEGITEVTVVLIDGGEEGAAGADSSSESSIWSDHGWANGNKAIMTNTNRSVTSTATASATNSVRGSACKGGEGGEGGKPGRVYRTKYSVTPGLGIPYSCGAAVPLGMENTETTFGELSSALGTASDSGYTDVVTGERFAYKGQNGENGGDGGQPGSTGSDTSYAKGGQGFTGGSTTRKDMSSLGGTINGYLGSTTIEASFSIGSSGGGGAGGSAGKVPGSAGGDAGLRGKEAATAEAGQKKGTARVAYSCGGDGGDGANAEPPSDYGCGGNGGGGGGGIGAHGTSTVNATTKVEAHLIKDIPSSYEYDMTARVDVYASGITTGIHNGLGGKGSVGKEGCIILYFSKKTKAPSGTFKDKQSRVLLDRFGRKFIV